MQHVLQRGGAAACAAAHAGAHAGAHAAAPCAGAYAAACAPAHTDESGSNPFFKVEIDLGGLC